MPSRCRGPALLSPSSPVPASSGLQRAVKNSSKTHALALLSQQQKCWCNDVRGRYEREIPWTPGNKHQVSPAVWLRTTEGQTSGLFSPSWSPPLTNSLLQSVGMFFLPIWDLLYLVKTLKVISSSIKISRVCILEMICDAIHFNLLNYKAKLKCTVVCWY